MKKFLIILINLILLANSISAIAKQEKIIKKPLHLKPTKTPVKPSLIDEFRHLPPEDLEFIRQIDKQFKLHGGNVTIKVERENITKTNKNSKRTIDGSLGYGYIQNGGNTGNYYFSEPHVMHKFTMQDAQHSHHEVATDIEIQQSQSYEIKESDFMSDFQRNKHHQHRQHHSERVYEDPVPVIVLRIPGPQKYAVHLQALLQQYLEMRAAMYIHALEEEERRGNLQHPQHYINQQHQAMQYYHQMMSSVPQHHHMMYQHYQPSAPPQQQQQHSHHHQPQPQQPHIMYYHQNQHHQQYPQQYIEVEHVADGYHQIPAGEQSYYHQSTAPGVDVTPGPSYLPPTGHQSQQEHPTSYINFVTPVYDQSELHHQQQHHPVTEDHNDDVHVAENYPSEKHTRVIYKKKNHPLVQPGIVYHQPEIQKRPIVVAEPQEDSYNHKDEYHHHHHHQQQISVSSNHRTNPPFNYHVAMSTLSPTIDELHERHHPKRMVSLTKEQFEKARRIVMKSKRSRGSMKQDRPTILTN